MDNSILANYPQIHVFLCFGGGGSGGFFFSSFFEVAHLKGNQWGDCQSTYGKHNGFTELNNWKPKS